MNEGALSLRFLTDLCSLNMSAGDMLGFIKLSCPCQQSFSESNPSDLLRLIIIQYIVKATAVFNIKHPRGR